MKVFILGSSGFITGELIRQLRAVGDVSIVAGMRHPTEWSFGPDVEVRLVEPTDAISIAAAMDGVTHTVDCVLGSPEAMIASATHLIEAVARVGGQRHVYISSIAVYGDAGGTVREDHSVGVNVNRYGAAKIECERILRHSQIADRVVTLRPALIYGAGPVRWTGCIAQLLKAHRLGDLGASGDGICNLIHVRDVARAAVASLTLPGLGGNTFNLVDPDSPTWNTFLMAFARALGTTPVRRIPVWQMDLERKFLAHAVKSLEVSARRLGFSASFPPPITQDLFLLFDRIVRYDGRAADVLIGSDRIDWRLGLAELAAYLADANR